MNQRQKTYLIVTILFIILSMFILSKTNITSSVDLSKSIQIIIILFLIRVSIGCTLYIRKQYEVRKYSYSIIMNLGLLIFINVSILRQINLLIQNWDLINIVDIYNNTLRSFSYYAMLTLPFIIILSIYSIISNTVLIKKEGFSPRRALGIALGIISLIGLCGVQTLYYIITRILINADRRFVKCALEICVNATLSYVYTLIIATLYCNIKAAKHIPNYDKDFIIILGSKINNDKTLPPLLKSRVDTAIEFANKQYEKTKKKIIYIPSGGQGSDEVIAESKAIEEYLIKKGINKKQIIIEDKAKNTYENMKFSKEKIDRINKEAKISFATNNYHVLRSGIIANDQGIECEGIGSKTKWYFYSNALIREFVANIVEERKKHLIILAVINMILLSLIVIGRCYNFLYLI